MSDKKKRSQYLALLLRHKPEAAGLHLADGGWVDVAELCKNTDFTLSELKSIVANDEKGRYSFDATFIRIRANQGHSVEVKMNFEEFVPTTFLYHGTSVHSLDSIFREGLKKMSRQYVHLSKDYETARKVGKRHGTVCVLAVNALQMHEDGKKFYISENGVVMTDSVEPKYLTRMV